MFKAIKLSIKSNYSTFSLRCDSPPSTLALGERVMSVISYPPTCNCIQTATIYILEWGLWHFCSKTWVCAYPYYTITILHLFLVIRWKLPRLTISSFGLNWAGFPPQLEVDFNQSDTLINVNVITRHLLSHLLCHQTYARRNNMEIIHLHQTNEVWSCRIIRLYEQH